MVGSRFDCCCYRIEVGFRVSTFSGYEYISYSNKGPIIDFYSSDYFYSFFEFTVLYHFKNYSFYKSKFLYVLNHHPDSVLVASASCYPEETCVIRAKNLVNDTVQGLDTFVNTLLRDFFDFAKEKATDFYGIDLDFLNHLPLGKNDIKVGGRSLYFNNHRVYVPTIFVPIDDYFFNFPLNDIDDLELDRIFEGYPIYDSSYEKYLILNGAEAKRIGDSSIFSYL